MSAFGLRRWQVVVMAKSPVAGRVKTRLCPPLAPAQAAELAAAAIGDTLGAVRASAACRCVVALDGTDWRPPAGVSVVPQRPGPFAGRLAGAMDDAWESLAVPMLVIGMDTPQVTPALLDLAAAVLGGYDAVLGPALDGGYWLIGSRRPVPGMFDGVPMSTASTGRAQHRRLDALGLTVGAAPALRDVDEFADALAVGVLAPATRFAARLRAMAVPAPAGLPGA